MPRNTRKKDPFARINNWDDGYEYIRDPPLSPPDSRDPPPFFSPPPPAGRPAPGYFESDRRYKPSREDESRYPRRAAYPSPPDSDDYTRRRQPPPPPYRAARSPSPPPRRSRRDVSPPRPRRRDLSPSSRSPSPLPRRSKSTRDTAPRRPRAYSRSPSPRRYPRAGRRSPSPILPGGRLHKPRDISPSPPPRAHPRVGRSPSPPRRAPRETRPNLSRSKSTTNPGSKQAKDRFAGLSPKWQKAAAAAFQAGSLAALNMRSQPGAWNGEKGARVATAALGAAAMNAFSGNKKGEGKGKDKARRKSSSGLDGLGGALGGLLIDQLAKRGRR